MEKKNKKWAILLFLTGSGLPEMFKSLISTCQHRLSAHLKLLQESKKGMNMQKISWASFSSSKRYTASDNPKSFSGQLQFILVASLPPRFLNKNQPNKKNLTLCYAGICNMATAMASHHSFFPKLLWISIEIRFMQPDYQLQWNLREGKGPGTVPYESWKPNTQQHVFGVSIAARWNSLQNWTGACAKNGQAHYTGLAVCMLCSYPAWPCERDVEEILESGWVECGEGSEKPVMRSTIEVQNKIRPQSFCFWQNFKW